MRKEEVAAHIERYKRVIYPSIYIFGLIGPENTAEATSNVVGMLDIADQGKELELFMKQTKYLVFDWAIKSHNLVVLDFLLKRLRAEHHFLMVEHDDYLPLRKFIDICLGMSPAEYRTVESIKEEILSKMIAVDPKLVVQTIEEHITATKGNENYNINRETYSLFKKSIENAKQRPVTLRNVKPLTVRELKRSVFEKEREKERSESQNESKRQRRNSP